MSASGIDSITPEGACAGSVITINGSGFGSTQPDDVDLVISTDGDCEIVETQSWTDTQIEFILPENARAGCVGFIDHTLLEKAKQQTQDRNNEMERLADLLTCLRQGSIHGRIPEPELTCPPCIDTNQLVAGVPLIRSFTVNNQRSITIDPGERLVLRWRVENADSITISRTSTSGPRFGSSNSITDPPGNSYDLGNATYNSPQQFTYQLRATNGCGSVNATVEVNATQEPKLSISQIEITQGLQTLAQTIPLVSSKQTMVRVYVQHGLVGFGANPSVPNVTGRMRTRASGGTWRSWRFPVNGTGPPPVPSSTASITVPTLIDRENIDDTLNFVIPAGWSRDTVDIQIEVTVAGFGAIGSFAGHDQTVFLADTAAFNNRRRLDLRYYPVRWRGRTPTTGEMAATLRASLPRIPCSGAAISQGSATVETPTFNPLPTMPPGLTAAQQQTWRDNATAAQRQSVLDLLDEYEDRRECAMLQPLRWTLGQGFIDFLCDEMFGDQIWALMTGDWDRGTAADVPANVFTTPVNTAPTTTTWSMADLNSKASHELSHCLNQTHLDMRTIAASCQRPPNGEVPTAPNWPNVGMHVEVPVDIAQNDTIAATAWDIMTYCGATERWPVETRFTRLYNFLAG
ncbi:MAG: IPT/TIG domain-containing protein [Acidimicrobiia bacterium]